MALPTWGRGWLDEGCGRSGGQWGRQVYFDIEVLLTLVNPGSCEAAPLLSGHGVEEHWGQPALLPCTESGWAQDTLQHVHTRTRRWAHHPLAREASGRNGPKLPSGNCACRRGGWVDGLVTGAHLGVSIGGFCHAEGLALAASVALGGQGYGLLPHWEDWVSCRWGGIGLQLWLPVLHGGW